MPSFTESLLDFISQAPSINIPDSMFSMATLGFTDAIAVMLAGSKESVVEKLLTYNSSLGQSNQCRIMMGEQRSTTASAALIGATAAHALDYDDYAYSNHPSAVMVPAILAEAETIGANGEQILRAYISGYEVWAATMKREKDHLHSKGWHPTSVFGAIGVVAAIASLRKLDRDTTRNAIGLAVAHSGGVMGNFGSMTKALQGGRAAQAGIFSIHMAMNGITAGSDALDGKLGMLAALSPNGNTDLETPADYLGKDWYGSVHGLNVKRYPTVGASQRVIDAAIQVREKHSINADDIERVTVHISEKHAAVMPFHNAKTDMEAKFSLEFATAAALISGNVGLRELKQDFVQRQDVQDLMSKVTLDIGPDNDPVYPVGAESDWIEVTTHNNTLISDKVQRALGHGLNPMPNQLIKEKFMSCATWTHDLNETQAERLYQQFQDLRSLKSMQELQLNP